MGGGGKDRVGMGLLKGGGAEEWIGGMEVETARGTGVEKPSGVKVDMPVVLGRDRGLDRPIVRGGELTVAAMLGGGKGEAGGVVSIPLSSIIFRAFGLKS